MCHLGCFPFHEPRQDHHARSLQNVSEGGRERHQRAGKDVREHEIRAPRNRCGGVAEPQAVAQAVRVRVVAGGDERLAVDVETACGAYTLSLHDVLPI